MDSEKVIKRDNEYVLHTYARNPIAIEKGHGLYAEGPEGQKYLDFTSGIGVNSLGYCDMTWAEAVSEHAPFGVWICFAGAALFGWTVVSKSEPAVRQTGGFSAGFLKYPTVWAITLAMALQSLMIYTTAAWLPTILRETRFSVEQAAVGVSIYLLISVPTSIATPWLIKLFRGERFTVLFAAVNYAVGVTLWLFGGKAALLGCLMAGVSQGLCLSLAMLVMARKTNSLTELFRISGFAQGIGYVIAGLGPRCCGVLYEATSQTYVIAVVMLATVAMWGASAAFAYAGDSIGNSV